ncbi:immunoglobulin I-set domain protein [Ancylostoma ceylanicum]|uniref:Immunoglobulin I-set domain protein n=1 Tax=Ancylostoma ceylanicum TaxID=53326 RepID=A0A0D6LJW5_9BILA|nr:immunoglobulin I-set domain protein [Ancylostoma ceylanicum]
MKKPKDGDKWVIEANRLTIYDVKKGIHGKGDNAVYQCKAENKHGYVWTNFYLNLLAFKPQLLTDAGEVEAVVGQSVTLECKFFASPNAVITWSSPLLQGIAHNVIPANPHGVGKLVIPNVTPDAEGEYECTGSNKYGQAKGAAKLLVESDHSLLVNNPTQYDSAKYKCVASTKLDKVEKEVQIQIKDTYENSPKNVPVPVHAAYVSKCDADSQSAEISFEHMEPADTVSPVKEFWYDLSNFFFGVATSTWECCYLYFLRVQYQMDSETEGTQWRTHPVPVQAHPNDRIEGDQRMVSGKATVALQPFGHYVFRVLARNGVGDSSPTRVKDVCITPPKQPDRNPAGVWAKGASPENIVVHWRPMAREEWNGKNFHYKIKYRPSEGGDGEWKEVQVNDPFADRYTITLDDDKDAKPFQPYEVQDGTTATFAWNPVDPKSANGNFTGYKITYWYDEAEEDEETNDVETMFRFKRSAKARLALHLRNDARLLERHVSVSAKAKCGEQTKNGRVWPEGHHRNGH